MLHILLRMLIQMRTSNLHQPCLCVPPVMKAYTHISSLLSGTCILHLQVWISFLNQYWWWADSCSLSLGSSANLACGNTLRIQKIHLTGWSLVSHIYNNDCIWDYVYRQETVYIRSWTPEFTFNFTVCWIILEHVHRIVSRILLKTPGI